jgi:hypothetical protein
LCGGGRPTWEAVAVCCAACRQNSSADTHTHVAHHLTVCSTGLHYDALAVAAFDGAPEELDVTILTVSGCC